MNQRFEITGIIQRRDFVSENTASLDNGEVQATLDLGKLRTTLRHAGVSSSVIIALMKKLEKYAGLVEAEKAKGIHLGSTSLASGLLSEIWTIPPQELGLQTEIEVRLVAALVEQFTQESKI